jgi:hypothetical protein
MDAFYQKPEQVVGGGASRRRPRGAQARAAFWQHIQAPYTRAAERFRATGGRTGELRQHWQGAVCRHTYRPRRADSAGCSVDNRLLTIAAP